MRKLLLLCAMLLSGIGAWAEDVFVMPENGKYYKLKGDNKDKPWLTKQLNSNSIVVSANEAEAAIFMKTENGFIEITTGRYLGMTGSVVSLVSSATTVTIGEHNDGNVTGNGTKYSVKVANNYMYNNNTDGMTHESSGWITNIERYWGFIEEKGFVVTIEGGTSGQHRGFLAAGEGFTAYPVLSDIAWSSHSGKSTTAITGGKYWYIRKINETDTYVLFNLGLQKYLVLESDDINFGDYPYAWKIVQNTSDPNYKAVCLWNGTKQISFACGYTGAQRNVRPNNEMDDGGSKHSIKYYLPAELGDFSDAINAINKVKNEVASLNNVSVPMTFKFTDNGLNPHSYTSAGGELYPLISGVENYSIYDPTWNGNTYNAEIVFPFAVSSNYELQPTLIGQGSWSGADKKWTVVNGNVQVVNGTPQLAASQWLIFPTLSSNGQFTFKIQSVSSDKYVTAKADSDNDPKAEYTPVTLTETGTGFQYIKTTRENDFGFAYQNNSGTTLFLTVNSTDANEVKLGVYGKSASHQGNAVRFPTFNEYEITIGSTGYATLYSPFSAFADDPNLGIYTVNSKPKNNSVELTPMGYVYVDQGVILKGSPNTTYRFGKTDDDYDGWVNAEDWKDNQLKGSFTNTYVPDSAYVLSAPDGVASVGLYKAMLNFTVAENGTGTKVEEGATGTHFKNNAGKAYLPASAVASDARFLVFNFGDDVETSIEELKGENGNVKTEVYDLAGRRIQGAQKGIFIVNGKKVVR